MSENISKAMIMAGSILIGVLLLSLLAYFWGILGEYNKNVLVKAENSEVINDYNAALLSIDMGQFDKIYNKTEKDNSVRSTVSDLITAINKAKDISDQNGDGWITKITLKLKGPNYSDGIKRGTLEINNKDLKDNIYNLINGYTILVQKNEDALKPGIKYRTGVSINTELLKHDEFGRIIDIEYNVKIYELRR